MELMQASRQWASRPDEQRFTSLTDLNEHMLDMRRRSKQSIVSNRQLTVEPEGNDHMGIVVKGPAGHPVYPTNHTFGQLCARLQAPAGFLRTLPSELVADTLNYRLKVGSDVDDIGILLTRQEQGVELRAATGPKYGRIWNAQVTSELVRRFGDGVTGDWRVPGEFGKQVEVTKANTTLYGSDRDMFVFLADETNRIEVPNRRDGNTGSMARGFFVWNSEVGAATLGVAFFLFDYACCNRIVWGATDYLERRIRHTASAPDRWLESVLPVLADYSHASAGPIEATIKVAQARKLDDRLNNWLNTRFTKSQLVNAKLAHIQEEGRPIETVWDQVTGLTAYAKSIPHQNDRVAVERLAGDVLSLVN